MFEMKIGEYWVKPIVISRCGEKIEIKRFLQAISKFGFKEKHVIKKESSESKEIYDTSALFLIGEKDKKELKKKYKELKDMKAGIQVSSYVITEYPFDKDCCKIALPHFKLPKQVANSMDKFNLNKNC